MSLPSPVKTTLLVVLWAVIGFLAGVGVLDLSRRWLQPPIVSEGDYSTYLDQAGASVVLFGTSTCPHCQRAREYLTARNVGYRELVIDESAEGRRLFDSLNEDGVPVLLVGTRLIRGFDPQEYDKALVVP